MDQTVNLQIFHPDSSALVKPQGITELAARWTGFLVPAESGTYKIGLSGSMNRMWLDGKLIVDDMVLHDPNPNTVPVKLEKDHRYPIKIEYGPGGFGSKLIWLPLIDDPIAKAVTAAKQADVAIAVVGITSHLEGEEMKVNVPGFKGGDRTSLDLPKEEEELVEALQKTGKPIVVVLMNGSALSVNWAAKHVNALLDAWYSGEEGGTAIAQTLAGTNNPAGRLPVTFYTGVEQLPPFEDYSMKDRTYRYFTGQPLYPFGYGLSYSKFSYSNLKLSSSDLNAGDSLSVDVDIKNISDQAGDEVAELYLQFPKSPSAPIRALRGFSRVHLAAGETQHVTFTLQPRDLSEVNESGDRIVAAGSYTVTVGGGQPGTGASTTESPFSIHGEQKLPE